MPFATAIEILMPLKLPGPKFTNIEKFLSILTFFSFIIGILAILFFYTFSSSLKNHYLETKNNLTTDKKYLAVITDNGLWIKDEIDGIISITNADKINNNFLPKKNSFIFESVEKRRIRGRYTIIGSEPDKIWEFKKKGIYLIQNNKTKVIKSNNFFI